MLWNASQVTARYLQSHAAALVRGKDVLELGAGAGLPGVVAGIEGGRKVRFLSHISGTVVFGERYRE